MAKLSLDMTHGKRRCPAMDGHGGRTKTQPDHGGVGMGTGFLESSATLADVTNAFLRAGNGPFARIHIFQAVVVHRIFLEARRTSNYKMGHYALPDHDP